MSQYLCLISIQESKKKTCTAHGNAGCYTDCTYKNRWLQQCLISSKFPSEVQYQKECRMPGCFTQPFEATDGTH
jgi:hypothetical protein